MEPGMGDRRIAVTAEKGKRIAFSAAYRKFVRRADPARAPKGRPRVWGRFSAERDSERLTKVPVSSGPEGTADLHYPERSFPYLDKKARKL